MGGSSVWRWSVLTWKMPRTSRRHRCKIMSFWRTLDWSVYFTWALRFSLAFTNPHRGHRTVCSNKDALRSVSHIKWQLQETFGFGWFIKPIIVYHPVIVAVYETQMSERRQKKGSRTHTVKTPTEISRELLVLGTNTGVEVMLTKTCDFCNGIYTLRPAAAGCTSPHLNALGMSVLLWKRLNEEPPVVFVICGRQTPERVSEPNSADILQNWNWLMLPNSQSINQIWFV